MLGLRQGPAFHDFHGIALVRLVLFIVSIANRSPFDVLAVTRVLHEAGNLHAPGLAGLVARHNADQGSPVAALGGCFRGCFRHGLTPSSRSWPRRAVSG